MAKILIAEDETNIREGLRLVLEGAGYTVVSACDGAEAVMLYASEQPDLVMLDVMMPNKNGYEACVEIRKKTPSVPIMMLSALSEEKDKVFGLGLGADDYIVKPFGEKIAELLARVAAVLRRSGINTTKSPAAKGVSFTFGGAWVDSVGMTLTSADAGGGTFELSNRELNMLKLFHDNAGAVLSRNYIMDEIWGMKYLGTTRTLDQYILKLRKKIGKDGALVIETVSGVGYRYNPG